LPISHLPFSIRKRAGKLINIFRGCNLFLIFLKKSFDLKLPEKRAFKALGQVIRGRIFLMKAGSALGQSEKTALSY
jgi:hypothetical protein